MIKRLTEEVTLKKAKQMMQKNKTDMFEMIISQHARFTLVVIQRPEPEAAEGEEGADGEKKAE